MAATSKSESPRVMGSLPLYLFSRVGRNRESKAFSPRNGSFWEPAMPQNASLMHSLRQRLSDPQHSPTAILGEVTAEVSISLKGRKSCSTWDKSRTKS